MQRFKVITKKQALSMGLDHEFKNNWVVYDNKMSEWNVNPKTKRSASAIVMEWNAAEEFKTNEIKTSVLLTRGHLSLIQGGLAA